MDQINLSSVVVATQDALSCEVKGEAVILHLGTGVYYGLDPVGAFVWSLLKEPISLSQIHERVLEEYEVASDRCERDLLALIKQMASTRIVSVQNAKAA
jgi:hypothetical protein